jgi:5-(carboxyamino)imidazole ribonucleotide synthase
MQPPLSEPKPALTVGLLGDGQLARMLAESLTLLGCEPIVLSSDPDSPAAQVCRKRVTTHQALFSETDLVLFENEFVDCDLLRKESQGHEELRFIPELRVIAEMQDKLKQKSWLKKAKFRVPAWKELPPFQGDLSPIRSFLSELREIPDFKRGIVLKWARLGYDGKGVLISKGEPDERMLEAFLGSAKSRGTPVFAEPLIPYSREVALVATRGLKGEFSHYSLVISEQENGICKRVTGPASSLGVPQSIENEAIEGARRLADDLGLVGTFAIEFFLVNDQELWVNEVAPRVHNSGHFTLNGSDTSQFENHCRAALGMALGSTKCRRLFAMQNLLGFEGTPTGAERTSLDPLVHLHDYGKRELRASRKMGHLNAASDDPEIQIDTLLKALQTSEDFWKFNRKFKGSLK